jgi:hypothetical protein
MDSNLKDYQSDNEFLFKNESLDDNNNNINLELESKWNEIEQKAQEKINEKNESRRLSNLNDFSIMRINLNSLIHPIDDSSEFEDYCKLKINQLEKIKQSIDKTTNITRHLFTFGEEQNDNININLNNKTFLKNDENELFIKQNGKYSLNDLYEINRNQNTKKTGIKRLINIIDTSSDNNKSSIINNVNNFENLNIIGNKSDKRISDTFTGKLNTKRNSFLKQDNDMVNDSISKYKSYTHKNNNKYSKYKGYNQNNINMSDKYRLNGNVTGIQNKIKENYNYLYSLYPNLKRKNN